MSDYRSALQTSRRLDLRIGIAAGLELISEVAISTGDAARAVRLAAAAQRLKAELGGGVPPPAGVALEPLVVAKGKLPPDDFDREMGVGRAMDLETAIAQALATKPPGGSGKREPTPWRLSLADRG